MEEHDTGDFAVLSYGKARVFGYDSNKIRGQEDIEDWDGYFEAVERHKPSGRRDFQLAGIVKTCDWCDQQAVGFVRFNCSCTDIPGGCRDWVCSEHMLIEV